MEIRYYLKQVPALYPLLDAVLLDQFRQLSAFIRVVQGARP